MEPKLNALKCSSCGGNLPESFFINNRIHCPYCGTVNFSGGTPQSQALIFNHCQIGQVAVGSQPVKKIVHHQNSGSIGICGFMFLVGYLWILGGQFFKWLLDNPGVTVISVFGILVLWTVISISQAEEKQRIKQKQDLEKERMRS
jgi:hypothetical protein